MNVDERLMRYVLPPSVFVLAVLFGLYVDPCIHAATVLKECGLPDSLAADVLLAASSLLALGLLLFSVTYILVLLFSRLFFWFLRWFLRCLRRDWAGGFFDAWSFWPKDLHRYIALCYGPGGQYRDTHFNSHRDSEFCGFFLENEMPEYVRTKLRRYWVFFYTNLNCTTALVLAWWFMVTRLDIHPTVTLVGTCTMLYERMLLLMGVVLSGLGIYAWWRAWMLEWFFVRRIGSLRERR